ncbi:uncharacterized protein [Dermacentor albipictus]|uniref:uncharacterized protein n=1 Tax=Dermacentor albipictus TaxID=60249 RepID=UPI0031FBF7BC
MSVVPAPDNKAANSQAGDHTDESGAEPTTKDMDILAPDHYERRKGHYLQMAKQLVSSIMATQMPKPECLSWQSERGASVGTHDSCQEQNAKERPSKMPCPKRGVKGQPQRGRGRGRGSPRRPVPAATVSATEQPPAESSIHRRWFTCHLCYKKLSRKGSLRSHLEGHAKKAPWTRACPNKAPTSTGSSADAPPNEDEPLAGPSSVPPVVLDSEPKK